MRRLTALAALLLAATASPAQSPAELFPPGTLAYAEVRGPALADGLAALVKGTPWADSLASLPDALDRADGPADVAEVRETAALALLTAPESLAELRRTRGAAAGLIGFSPKGRPRYTAVLLTGDSALAALVVRQRLTADPSLRRVASHGAVAVFQRRGPTPPDDADAPAGPPEPPKPFPPGDDEPTYATVPGLLAVGSDLDAVRDVLERFKTPARSPSLAGVTGFKTAYEALAPRVVGFLYATPAAGLAAADRARAPGTPDPLGVARFLFDGPGWATLTGQLTLNDDHVELTLHADFDKLPPLAAALAGPALSPADAARVRRGAQSDLALTVPPGDGRADRWLSLADAVAAGRGRIGAKPSRLVADLDRAAKNTAVRELLSGVTGLSVAHGPRGPVAVAHLDGSPAAGRWASELPRLLPEFGGKSAGVSSEVVAGARVFTLQWGDGEARTRLTVAATPQAVYVAADRAAVEELLKPPSPAAAVPKSRGVVEAATLLDAWAGASPPEAPTPPADELPPGAAQALAGGRVDIVSFETRGGVPTQPGLLDFAHRRLRWLPPLALDAAVAPASPNRVALTVRLPDAKAALRTLFAPPKPTPAEPDDKDAEKPVPPDAP